MRWRRIILLGVLAFGVGTLFRLAAVTGINLFRMFGTMGIGIAGAVAAWTMSRWQVETGAETVQRRLAELEKVKLYRVADDLQAPDVRGEVLVEHEGLYYLIAMTKLPHYGGRRFVRRARAAIVQVESWGGGFEPGQLARILVYLRRGIRDEELRFAEDHGVVLVNPEGIEPAALRKAAKLATGLAR